MIDRSFLDMNLTGWSLLFSAIVMGIAVLLSYVSCRRSNFRSSILKLEMLRLLIIALVVFLLQQPEWTSQYQPETKPRITVYYDDSPSMETLDMLSADGVDSRAISRSRSVADLIKRSAWDSLSNRFDILIEKMSGLPGIPSSSGGSASPKVEPDFTDGVTDLSRPLSVAVKGKEGLAGVVLITDGDWNEGASPVDAAAKLRGLRIPVFTVTAGSNKKLPDLELINADVPTFGAVRKPVRIPFSIDSSLPRENRLRVRLTVDGEEAVSKEIRVSAMGRTSDSLQWFPEQEGDFVVSIEFPVQKEEKIETNNSITLPISIREEQLKVLVIESLPRWEYRYLRNALSRDPGVEVSCLLFHPGLDKVGGGSEDYLKVFPEELEDLSKFDVVFLGDVGLDDAQLTESQCELIRGLVEFQASGLILMPGFQGRQFSLLSTKLGELYPVLLNQEQPQGWGSRLPGHFELSERGRDSLLTKLADSNEENYSVWEGLPGFQWYAPVLRAKAGCEVLAVHKDVSNESGRLPLLVTRPFGAGKVLFMGTDGAWRWRKGVEDKYHYRFWGQVVRWMAYQRNMAKGETIRLFHTPDQPQVRQTVNMTAHIMDRIGEPLEGGEITAMITSPSKVITTVRLSGENDQWGVYRGQFDTAEPGQHSVLISCKETEAALKTQFYVQGNLSEPIGKPARPEVLQEIARVSRGANVRPDEVASLMDAILDLPEPEPTTRRLQLWAHPATAGILLLLLACFWISRKAVGLI